jgi:hypothetical protein
MGSARACSNHVSVVTFLLVLARAAISTMLFAFGYRLDRGSLDLNGMLGRLLPLKSNHLNLNGVKRVAHSCGYLFFAMTTRDVLRREGTRARSVRFERSR